MPTPSDCGISKYDVELNNKKVEESDKARAAEKRSGHVKAKLRHAQKDRVLEERLANQFNGGRLLACISSRPGQSGRADGYILEGAELAFYQKKLDRRKGKK